MLKADPSLVGMEGYHEVPRTHHTRRFPLSHSLEATQHIHWRLGCGRQSPPPTPSSPPAHDDDDDDDDDGADGDGDDDGEGDEGDGEEGKMPPLCDSSDSEESDESDERSLSRSLSLTRENARLRAENRSLGKDIIFMYHELVNCGEWSGDNSS